MAPSAHAQRRTHNSLLFQKLLNLRDGASPFTLLLDSLEQSAKPVVREFIVRAKISKAKLIFISFETLKKPKNVDVFIRAHGKPLQSLHGEISSHVPKPMAASATAPGAATRAAKTLLIFDTLHPLCSAAYAELPMFLSSLLSPTTSMLAVYHTDIPLVPTSSNSSSYNAYAPSPLQTLLYLATAILTIRRFSHEVTKKKARDKSLAEPGFGIREGREGVIIGLGDSYGREVVVEMEVRRKSGRGVREVFILTPATSQPTPTPKITTPSANQTKAQLANVVLLDDHPLFSKPEDPGEKADGDEEEHESTFSLGLTEKQRRDREGVVLPYFDAQKDGGGSGPGEGGRILYEMGREDDFDEDEDDEF